MPNFGASSGKVHAFWQFHGAPYKTYCVQVIGLPLPSLCMSLFFVISSSPSLVYHVCSFSPLFHFIHPSSASVRVDPLSDFQLPPSELPTPVRSPSRLSAPPSPLYSVRRPPMRGRMRTRFLLLSRPATTTGARGKRAEGATSVSQPPSPKERIAKANAGAPD